MCVLFFFSGLRRALAKHISDDLAVELAASAATGVGGKLANER